MVQTFHDAFGAWSRWLPSRERIILLLKMPLMKEEEMVISPYQCPHLLK
jgi:hypothetical protein